MEIYVISNCGIIPTNDNYDGDEILSRMYCDTIDLLQIKHLGLFNHRSLRTLKNVVPQRHPFHRIALMREVMPLPMRYSRLIRRVKQIVAKHGIDAAHRYLDKRGLLRSYMTGIEGYQGDQ